MKIYLSGEIHTTWRDEIVKSSNALSLPVSFLMPITDHTNSDDCGVDILGRETDKFWHDYKSASMNSIRTNYLIKSSDIVVIKFGEKYRQWNAAFDAGLAVAFNKSIITLHDKSLDHALKEINAAAKVTCRTNEQVVQTINYLLNQS